MGHLRGHLMKGECRNETDHGGRNPSSYGDEVKVLKRLLTGKAIEPTGQFFDFTGIPKTIERPGMNAEPEGITGTDDPPLFQNEGFCLM